MKYLVRYTSYGDTVEVAVFSRLEDHAPEIAFGFLSQAGLWAKVSRWERTVSAVNEDDSLLMSIWNQVRDCSNHVRRLGESL